MRHFQSPSGTLALLHAGSCGFWAQYPDGGPLGPPGAPGPPGPPGPPGLSVACRLRIFSAVRQNLDVI